MSRLADALREIRVFNTHEVLKRFGGPNDVAIIYSPQGDARSGRPPHALVYSVHHKTDPGGPLDNYGAKWFSGVREKSIPAAKAWAAEHYQITEWATDPTDRSNLVPVHVRKAAEQAAREVRRGKAAQA